MDEINNPPHTLQPKSTSILIFSYSETGARNIELSGDIDEKFIKKSGNKVIMTPEPPASAAKRFRMTIESLNLAIKRDEEGGVIAWNAVSGDMAKALPGQKMNFKLDESHLPSAVTISDCRWTVIGGKFKDYSADKVKARKTSLEQSDFDQKVLSFYWSQTGFQSVKVRCKINDLPITMQVAINVVEPRSKITSRTGKVIVYGSTVELVGLLAGNVFDAQVDSLMGDFGAEGEWNLVQTINNKDYAISNSGSLYHSNHYGEIVLDTDYPYEVGGPTGASRRTADSPITPYDNKYKEGGTEDRFSMYIMFKPPGANTKWVPLKALDWFWKYDAVKIQNGIWSLKPEAGARAGERSPGQSTHIHPEWEANVDPVIMKLKQ